MPDPVTHQVFARQVISELSDEIRKIIDLQMCDRASQGPDPWSTIGFYGGKNKKYSSRSSFMHKEKTGLFLSKLAENVKKDASCEGFSVLVGAICHYSLDRFAHPYIICKGGEYDGTEDTRELSGGHVRLERAIDSYYIRHTYGKIPWRFSVPLQIMKLKRYPESLRSVLDATYREVYGWENVFDLINKSLRDERLFYGLMQDPFGIVHRLLRPVSNGRINYCVYSFYHRDIDSAELDYLNLQHCQWHHPYDTSSVSADSFFDLADHAKMEASEMIRKIYSWIFLDKDILPETVFADYNYSTGFPCDDSRNGNKPVYEPLIYPDKYRNKR